MATVTYGCSVDPNCPSTSDRPAYCQTHGERLEIVRPSVPAEPPAPADAGPAAADTGAAAADTAPPVALDFRGEFLPVPPGGLTLGRDCAACAHVPGLSELLQISRRHARLYWHDGELTVADLNSRNGTYVNGTRVETPRPLPAGSTLRLGLDVEIPVVELDEFGFPRR